MPVLDLTGSPGGNTSCGQKGIACVTMWAVRNLRAIFLLPIIAITQCVGARPPVIIVPGSLHSSLQVSHDSGANWSNLYLNWSLLRPPEQRQAAWIGAIALNTSTGYPPSDPDGVSVRTAQGWWSGDAFGSLDAIPQRDPWTYPANSSYATFLSALQQKGGYEPGVDLFAAPYDWRRAPDTLVHFFGALAALVVRASRDGQRRVALLGHSAGPSVALAFLNGRSAAWKARFVHALVSINGNLGGEIDCLENLWQGGDFVNAQAGVASWPTALYRERAQWSWPITAWCMPSVALYGERILVTLAGDPKQQQPERRYAATNLSALLSTFGAASLRAQYEHVANLTAPAVDPGVRVACLWGTGLPTPVHYFFAAGNISAPAVVTFASGDGQQDDSTNSLCASFAGSVPAWVQAFEGADHDSLLADPLLMAHLLARVLVSDVSAS